MAIMTLGRSKNPKMGFKHQLPVRVNLAAWYRYKVAVTNINGAASAWADQSGNNRPLLQATALARPAIRSDGALVFDGVNDAMAAAFTLSQPLTIAMAFQQISWTSGDILIDGSTGTVKVSQATGTPGLTANAGSSLANNTTIPLTSPGAFVFVASGTSSVYQAAGGAASVTVSGDANTNNAGGITLGSDRSGGNFANIAVYEVVAYSVALGAQDRINLLRYLSRIAHFGGVT